MSQVEYNLELEGLDPEYVRVLIDKRWYFRKANQNLKELTLPLGHIFVLNGNPVDRTDSISLKEAFQLKVKVRRLPTTIGINDVFVNTNATIIGSVSELISEDGTLNI